MKQEIAWNRLFIEALVIVGSILLAFAIDAWWSDRQQTQDKQIVLQALLDDIEQKRITLIENQLFNDAMATSALTILKSAEAGTVPNSTQLDQLIADLLWFNSEGKWNSAPIDSLILGGNIAQISDPELIQAIARVNLSLEDLRRTSRRDEAFHAEILQPFMTGHANLPQLKTYQNHLPGRPDVPYITPEYGQRDSFDHSILLTNQEFLNLVHLRIMHITDIENVGYTDFEEELDHVTNLLRVEMER